MLSSAKPGVFQDGVLTSDLANIKLAAHRESNTITYPNQMNTNTKPDPAILNCLGLPRNRSRLQFSGDGYLPVFLLWGVRGSFSFSDSMADTSFLGHGGLCQGNNRALLADEFGRQGFPHQSFRSGKP